MDDRVSTCRYRSKAAHPVNPQGGPLFGAVEEDADISHIGFREENQTVLLGARGLTAFDEYTYCSSQRNPDPTVRNNIGR